MCGIAGYLSPPWYIQIWVMILLKLDSAARVQRSRRVFIWQQVAPNQLKFTSRAFEGDVQWEAVRHWLIRLADAVQAESIGAGCCVTLQGDKEWSVKPWEI